MAGVCIAQRVGRITARLSNMKAIVSSILCGASLHNQMNGHGPDRASYEKAVAATLAPHKIEDTMAFMFESRAVIRPTRWAMQTPAMQLDYDNCWAGFTKAVLPQ